MKQFITVYSTLFPSEPWSAPVLVDRDIAARYRLTDGQTLTYEESVRVDYAVAERRCLELMSDHPYSGGEA